MSWFKDLFRGKRRDAEVHNNKREDKDPELLLPNLFCDLWGIDRDSLGFSQTISKNTIRRVRKYQKMPRPNANAKIKYPQYKVEGNLVLRGTTIDDIKLGQVLTIPDHKNFLFNLEVMVDREKALTKLGEIIFEGIKHYSDIPIVRFCMSLPYLSSRSPTAKSLKSPKVLVEVYKGIDNLLFEIYEELDEGAKISDELMLKKTKLILG